MVAALPPSQQQQADQQQQPPVFIDLGSGLGRVVMQAALLCGRQFSRYIGLELSTSRLEQAETVLARLREEAGRQQDIAASDALARVDFYEEDVTQSPWLDAASHVFICSTAFGAVACRQIVDRLAASDK
jgi:tRNA G46 methylase TrmB